jgi:transcriptional regulator with XRE-family HTH domain
MEDGMTFAQKLRQLRDTKGLSEARLSRESGIALGTLHSYGLGNRKPSLAAAVRIARALGVTCEAFADCEDVAVEEDSAPGKPGRPRKAEGKAARARKGK